MDLLTVGGGFMMFWGFFYLVKYLLSSKQEDKQMAIVLIAIGAVALIPLLFGLKI